MAGVYRMTTWSSLHPDEATLIGVVWFKEPGAYNYTVPVGANWVRAVAQGCGGQGDHWGGSGALARSRRMVTPGDNLKVQVGQVNTTSVLGDSWVERNDNSVICYADRGRGVGTAGLAANSTGDVTRDGAPGASNAGGLPPSDSADYAPLGFGGVSAQFSLSHASDYGGGGLVATGSDENGITIIIGSYGAGTGLVVLEFFDTDPGY